MENYNIQNKNKSIFFLTLESLYLAIISTFKTLSSNTTTLLITFLVVFIIIYILSLRILVLPCFNCSKGSWWYKCATGTGYGTKTCEWYDDIVKKTDDLITYSLRFKYNIYNRIFSVLEHQHELLNQYFVWQDDMFYAILNLNPVSAFMLFIYNAVVPPMMKTFANIFKELENANIEFILPVINVKLDIAEIIILALKGTLWFITTIFTLIMDLFFLLAKGIYEFIFKPMFSTLIYSISNFFNILSGLFTRIGIGFSKLFHVIKQPLIFIEKLNIQDIILLIFELIIKSVMSVLTISPQFIEIFPTIIVICIILYILFFIIVPLIGASVCVIRLVKAIIYLLLACDDDEDLRLIFVNIFNSIFKTNI
tara:strand:+ start:4374 stop:5474 length:1101 start_codon:yes stop_codon:yes gene_type:complete